MYYNLLSLEEERKPNRMQNAVDYKTSVLVPGPWLQLHCTLSRYLKKNLISLLHAVSNKTWVSNTVKSHRNRAAFSDF